MFNKKIKNEFIEKLDSAGVSRNYKNNFKILLKQAEKVENELNKDLFDFDLEETKIFLKSLRSKSIKSITTRKSMIVMYRKWAFQQKLTQNIYITKAIEKLEPKQLINVIAEKSKYITKEELYTWTMEMPNIRDSVILLLLWWGIKGSKFKEIKYLKEKDIDLKNRIIKLKDREIKVDDFTVEMINNCMNTDDYLCFTKNFDTRVNPLAESEYLIKNVIIKKKDEENFYGQPISEQTIQRIVRENKHLIDNDYVNVTTLYKSGQYHRFKEKYGEQAEYIIKKMKNSKNQRIEKNDLDFVRNFLENDEKEELKSEAKENTFFHNYMRYLDAMKKNKMEEVAFESILNKS